MFLPIGDTPNPPITPYVTYLLMGVNIAVFLFVSLPLTFAAPDLSDPLLLEFLRAMGARGTVTARDVLEQVSAYDLAIFRYGFRPAEPSLTTLFTAMFLHGGWLHLGSNMLFLYIFGDNVEHRLGRLGFLLAYLGTGIAATLFFALFLPDSQVPMVGASGAISGVLGFYFLWFSRNRVRTFVFLFPFIVGTFYIPARLVLGFYLLIDNLIPFLATAGRSMGVAHGAHIGGFLAGVGFAWVVGRWTTRQAGEQARFSRPRPQKEPALSPDPGEAIADHLRRGEDGEAIARYFSLHGSAARDQVSTGSILAVGERLFDSGAYRQALSVFRRLIAERPADPQLDRAYLGAGKSLTHLPRRIPTAYQYFLSAIDVARTSEIADEARLHLRAIERLGNR